MANRIAAIQVGSSPSQWRHVGTAHNPVDIVSRGISPSRLASYTSWLRGPNFLWKDKDAWLVAPIGLISTSPVDQELLKVHQVNCTNTFDTASDKVILYRLLAHYFSWSRLRRAVAYLNSSRLNNSCSLKVKTESPKICFLLDTYRLKSLGLLP